MPSFLGFATPSKKETGRNADLEGQKSIGALFPTPEKQPEKDVASTDCVARDAIVSVAYPTEAKATGKTKSTGTTPQTSPAALPAHASSRQKSEAAKDDGRANRSSQKALFKDTFGWAKSRADKDVSTGAKEKSPAGVKQTRGAAVKDSAAVGNENLGPSKRPILAPLKVSH